MSKVIDLQPVMKEVLAIMEKHGLSNPAVAIAFTAKEDYRQVHWIINVSREDGITLLKETAQKMVAKAN